METNFKSASLTAISEAELTSIEGGRGRDPIDMSPVSALIGAGIGSWFGMTIPGGLIGGAVGGAIAAFIDWLF